MANATALDTPPLFQLSRCAFRQLNQLPTAAAERGVEPDPLFADARRHRLVGLLQAARSTPLPSDRWTRSAYGQAQYTARCAAEAERLYALLEPRLSFLALVKGPILAQQAWPDQGMRSFDDLDFRCGHADFPALCEGLLRAGYQPKITHPRQRAHRWHYGWGSGFAHPDGFTVEVNHRHFPPHYPWPAHLRATDPAHYRLEHLDAGAVRAPTPALHLLLACLHALWHGGERFSWVVDIAGLLVRHPSAFAEADAWVHDEGYARRALHAGCAIAERLLGPGLMANCLVHAPEAALYRYIDQLAHPDAYPAHQAATLHRLLLGPGEQIRYTLRRACIPGDGDFQWLALPPRLRFLYWGLRPMRGAICGLQRFFPQRPA